MDIVNVFFVVLSGGLMKVDGEMERCTYRSTDFSGPAVALQRGFTSQGNSDPTHSRGRNLFTGPFLGRMIISC